MKQKAVILNLRVARSSDFSNDLGEKKYGCMYFQQSINGTFCNQPYFFHENTDMWVFRELYNTNQIWVLSGIFDDVEIIDKRKPIKTNVRSNTKQRNSFRIARKDSCTKHFSSSRPCTCKRNK